MIRSLALAVSLALGTVCIPAHALGLGDIKSRSVLNQNFDADVNLLSVVTGEIDSIRVRLATQDAFKRAGVERPFYLSLLKFKPVRLDNGSAVIRITSDFPIREPFLNFLLEVNWPHGRLVREYTVLLDPPTTTRKRAPRIAKAPAKTAAPKPRNERTSIVTPVESTDQGADLEEYGPIKANETLWGISKRVRPKGVPLDKMMIALQQANPQAFIDNNINKLRKGQILRVPDSNEIHEISRANAINAIREQENEWLSSRNDIVQKIGDKPAKASGSDLPVKPDDDEEDLSSRPDDQLKIVTSRPVDAESAGAVGAAGTDKDESTSLVVDELQGKLLLAEENAETSRLETEGLRNQMTDLIKRLDAMQKLINLQNNQLAQLQDNVSRGMSDQAINRATSPALPQEVSDPAAQASAAIEAKESIDGMQSSPDPQTGAVPESATSSAVPDDVTSQESTPVVPEKVAASVEQNAASEVDKAATQQAMAPSTVELDEATSPAETSEIKKQWEKFFAEYQLYILGAGGVLLLLLLLLFLGRRKKTEDDDVSLEKESISDESILLDESGADLDLDTEDTVLPSDNDTSFLSEFSSSDVNALQDETGEVDPVSEADVYIAYGRYKQSEELLMEALAKDPGRLALKHKLLEVYYATRDQNAFATLAQEMLDGGQDIADEEAWLRAKDMGRELDPRNPIFGAAENNTEAVEPPAFESPFLQETASKPSDDEVLSLDDLELSALASDLSSTEEASYDAGTAEIEPDLPLDLDDLAEDLNVKTAQPPVLNDELESLDLDLPDLDSEELESQLNQAGANSGDDSILSDDSVLTAEDLQAQLDELSDLSMLDTEISGMVADESEVLELPTEGSLDQPMSLDDAFDDGLDETVENVEMETLIQEESHQDVDEDAVSTKLDLAKAYVEMGDEDGARSILEEVKSEGTSSQKSEADILLSNMG